MGTTVGAGDRQLPGACALQQELAALVSTHLTGHATSSRPDGTLNPYEDRRHDHRQRRRPRRRATGPLRAPSPRQVPGRRAQGRPQGRRYRRVAVPGVRSAEHRAQRRGGPTAGGVRDRPDQLRRDPARVLRHREAHPRHERQRRPRLAQLPVTARLRRPAVRRPRRQGGGARTGAGVQRLAHRRVVRGAPGSVHPARRAHDLGSRNARGRDPPGRRQGMPRGDVPGEPGAARAAEPALRPLGPVLGGVRRRGDDRLHAHRLVVEAGRRRPPTRRST